MFKVWVASLLLFQIIAIHSHAVDHSHHGIGKHKYHRRELIEEAANCSTELPTPTKKSLEDLQAECDAQCVAESMARITGYCDETYGCLCVHMGGAAPPEPTTPVGPVVCDPEECENSCPRMIIHGEYNPTYGCFCLYPP